MKYIEILRFAAEILKLALNEGWFDGLLQTGLTTQPRKGSKRKKRH